MTTKMLALGLSMAFFISACSVPSDSSSQTSVNNAQTPATQISATQTTKTQEAKISAENTQIKEDSLETSIQKMKTFMAENPVDTTILNKPPSTDATFKGEIIGKGSFQNLNYMSSGDAYIQKKADQYYAVFDQNFKTPNGPDIRVYLTKNSAPTQRDDIKAGIELGVLKSVDGKQTYAIPIGTKIEDFHSISLHCKAFNVPWSYAVLK